MLTSAQLAHIFYHFCLLLWHQSNTRGTGTSFSCCIFFQWVLSLWVSLKVELVFFFSFSFKEPIFLERIQSTNTKKSSVTYIRFCFLNPPGKLLPPWGAFKELWTFPSVLFWIHKAWRAHILWHLYTVSVNQLEWFDLRVQSLDEILSQMCFFRSSVHTGIGSVGHGLTIRRGSCWVSGETCWNFPDGGYEELKFLRDYLIPKCHVDCLELHLYPYVQVQMVCD